jgi:hypothetical protein
MVVSSASASVAIVSASSGGVSTLSVSLFCASALARKHEAVASLVSFEGIFIKALVKREKMVEEVVAWIVPLVVCHVLSVCR